MLQVVGGKLKVSREHIATSTEIHETEEIKQHNPLIIPKPVKMLMLDITQGRTHSKLRENYFCTTHKLIVNTAHLKHCSHLINIGDPNRFN